ncbi:MAG TPA: hypothetical protein VN375_18290 [Vicinamibacteria bacterium]|nr:hypothetical protein [Vicinamibacteria bacterium]
MLERAPGGRAPRASFCAFPGAAFGRTLQADPVDEARGRAAFAPLPRSRKKT